MRCDWRENCYVCFTIEPLVFSVVARRRRKAKTERVEGKKITFSRSGVEMDDVHISGVDENVCKYTKASVSRVNKR